jgi:hypothetical protein
VALRRSIALGSTLIDWDQNSCIQVEDSFLVCSLGEKLAAATGPAPATLPTAAQPPIALAPLPEYRNENEALICKLSQKTEF